MFETTHISIVIYYLPSIETICKFSLVCKRYLESTSMLSQFNSIKMNEKGGQIKKVVPNNLFELFPNIKIIECSLCEIIGKKRIIKNVANLKLTIDGNKENMCLPSNEICEKVIELRYYGDLANTHPLNKYPNISKVKIEDSRKGYKNFIGNEESKLDQLIIKTADNEDLDCLKNYEKIKNKVIIIKYGISNERFDILNSFAIVKLNRIIEGISTKDYLYFNSFVELNNKNNIQEIYTLTLFTKCFTCCDCDLRKCEFLEILKCSFNQFFIQLNGLKQLRRIENSLNVDCVPQSVNSLNIFSNSNFQQLLTNNKQCFKNIKYLTLTLLKECLDTTIFALFKNCLKMTIQSMSSSICISLPKSLVELNFFSHEITDKQLEIISELIHLKKLTLIDDIKIVNNNKFQQTLNNLKSLNHLNTQSENINGIVIPVHIVSLAVEIADTLYLGEYTHFKCIEVNSGTDVVFVQLPNKLDKLIINGNINILNSNCVEAKTIVIKGRIFGSAHFKTNNYEVDTFLSHNTLQQN